MKDVMLIVTNKGFWLIALLCVLFYSAVFPFIKYATDLMVQKYNVDPKLAGNIPGKTGTVSQKIAMVIQDGDYKTAGFWSAVVLLVGFLAMTAMNLLGNRRKKNQKQW